MKPLVQVTRLSAYAGKAVIVDGVDFEVWPGQVTALVGASGSGKTTSALALLGEHGDQVRLFGQVEVAGEVVVDSNGPTSAAAGVRGRVVAYMPQHPGSALNPARRIGAGLHELEKLHHPGEDVVTEALRAAQLPSDRATLRRFPHQFSGGQRQRIALAQALTCRPRVLVLDEPSTGLDSVTRLQLVGELLELAAEGLGILLLSHDLDLVRALAQYVVVLDAGQVIASGGPEVLPEPVDLPIEPATKQSAEPLLEAANLSASVRPRGRDPILREVDLSVRPGSCLGVVGRSGSGKTTLARCLAGLHERHTGRITLDGRDLPVLRKRSAEQNRRVQYVWQEVRGSFDERRPVLDQVARTARRLRNLAAEQAEAEAVATLARLGVSALVAARPPSQLSGGELQRAALARALLAQPDVLICDEITTALDEHGTALVVELLRELTTQGTALVWISHDLGLVAAVADHVLVIDHGRVAERGAPVAVMTRPSTEVARRLVRAARVGHEPPPPVLTLSADTRSNPQ
ncbi:ABC transporter related protein [Kribbella flavida DSM 17836]|uniref:ABC transporter related protein n=1 Tax=Kribbella flavida (strain DSM 17836 / JCM 10339 / NBRC 14399) TaxID=479435 RepID=D2PQ45_KRIFD|nr:ATP-binding cassette domain-containing protein [Kribbella flavida]ADB34747.1 ABC transporter related protein [Kribbella flavida DSM 17836]